MAELRRGDVVWVDLDGSRGREQMGRRPALVVASTTYIRQAKGLVIVVPATTAERNWPNHVRLSGKLSLDRPTFAMTEQLRTISRERIVAAAGTVDKQTMNQVETWLKDFLGLR